MLVWLLATVAVSLAQSTDPSICLDASVGIYASGCSSDVTFCSETGRATPLMCPFGQVFDQIASVCDSAENVAACNNGEGAEVDNVITPISLDFCVNRDNGLYPVTDCSASVVTCLEGQSSNLFECAQDEAFDVDADQCQPSALVSACDRLERSSETEADCAALGDGLFEDGNCSTTFLTCSGGVSRVMNCPSGLIYDGKNELCDFPANLVGCEAKAANSCADGFYSNGNCSDSFTACAAGQNYTMFCPASLAFSETTQRCEYPRDVAECQGSGEEPTESTTSGEGSGIEGSGSESGDVEQVEQVIPLVPGKDQEINTAANSSIPVEEQSASGVEQTTVDGSAETSGETGGASEASGIESSGLENSGSEASGIESSGVEGSGSEESSGIEVSGSEASGIEGSGSEGILIEGSGSEGILIEGSGSESSGNDGSGSEGSGIDGSAEEESSGLTGNSTDGRFVVSAFCATRNNGFYGLGCSSTMAACSNRLGFLMDCPAHLVYNQSRGFCQFPAEVAECRQGNSEEVTNEVSNDEPLSGALPVRLEDDKCSSKDVSTNADCHTEFVNCIDGKKVAMRCSSGLVFSSILSSCVVASEAPECISSNMIE